MERSQVGALVGLYLPDPRIGNPDLFGKAGPAAHGFNDAVNHLVGACFFDVSDLGEGEQVLALKPVALAVDAHLVSARPLAAWVPRIGDVKGRCQPPFASSIH